MDTAAIFLTVALAHFLALLSPGPDFLLVVKSAVRNRVRTAVGVAVGIAVANAVYIALCLVGVGALLSGSEKLMVFLRIAGGLFLTYLGYCALKAKKADYAFLLDPVVHAQSGDARESTFAKEFLVGFASGILNPKNLLFYLSLFTLVLNGDVALGFKLALGIWMTLVVAVWDVLIILVLSHGRVRRAFNQCAYHIDKLTGLILGALGVKIVHAALTRN